MLGEGARLGVTKVGLFNISKFNNILTDIWMGKTAVDVQMEGAHSVQIAVIGEMSQAREFILSHSNVCIRKASRHHKKGLPEYAVHTLFL